MLNETAEQDRTKDIATDINQAYESVDVHYVEPHEVGKAGSVSTAEAIYEFLSDALTVVIKYCVVFLCDIATH